METAIAAIANPVRRRMLMLVRGRERASSELAAAVGLTRPAASQHLRVLREAGLVATRGEGGFRYYRADEERLEAVRAHLEDFWTGRMEMLKEVAERRHRARRPGS